ncbi:MAG TPA: lysophospholipid acyltransferase family protein [Burkholderiaceae bacterium]|nr:lysophospholipid acyltransferase family protein [Burkholderiaceae bacterium]
MHGPDRRVVADAIDADAIDGIDAGPIRAAAAAIGGAPPVAGRALRLVLAPVALVLVSLHLAWGLAWAALAFPWLPLPARNRAIRLWSRMLLAIVGVRLEPRGQPIDAHRAACGIDGANAGGCLVVANHVSWLDVFAIDALVPSRFIAKADITSWPVVGWLVTLVGTLYVERGRRHAVASINRSLARHLKRGETLAIFPEGTTSDGTRLQRFHANLIQPALDEASEVRPVAISYSQSGIRSQAATYIGDTTLVASLWRVITAPRLVVTLDWLPPIPLATGNRHAVARAARLAIAEAIGAPLDDA